MKPKHEIEYTFELPHNIQELDQDEEYCVLQLNGQQRKIRFHDYDEIYKIPGLYEHLFYETLECQSHEVVSSFLKDAVDDVEQAFSDLRILELGAGNGLVGEIFADEGADTIVGVDILEEAAQAAERDRPHVYDEYFVTDLTKPDDTTRAALESEDFNCLVCVAALGYGDIPPEAFSEAYNLIDTGGWVAFNIKERFINGSDASGFSRLIQHIREEDILDLKMMHRYQHRLSVNGSPLHYVAMIGRKADDIPEAYFAE